MFGKLSGAIFSSLFVLGVAAGGEFRAIITKVEGAKVTFKRGTLEEGKKRISYSRQDETMLAAEIIKVTRAKINRETKKIEPGEDLPGGLASEQLKNIAEPGIPARIITDESGKQIKEMEVLILTLLKKKPQ